MKKINLELTIFLHIYKTQNSSSEKYEIMKNKLGNFKIQLNTYVVNEKWNKTLFHIDNLIKRQ